MKPQFIKLAAALPLLLALQGCMAQVGEANDGSLESTSDALVLPEVAFETFTDPAGIGSAGGVETKRLIRNAAEYRSLFGHSAPASVRFAAGDQVVFYSAGVKPTTGYTAAILRVERTSLVLRIATRLEAPGESCFTAPVRTIPYVLAKVRVGQAAYLGQFLATEKVTEDCDAVTCDDLECDEGTHCELEEVVCVRWPCPPIPRCVPGTEPVGPFCGGIAARPCPGKGECVDNPNDNCDPRQGGADCGGVCECNVEASCPTGYAWSSEPDVCGCKRTSLNSCAHVLCPLSSRCKVIDGEATCQPFLPATGPAI